MTDQSRKLNRAEMSTNVRDPERTDVIENRSATGAAGGKVASRFVRGAAVGKYRIIRELGRGGQGCVLLAEDPDLGRLVALKTITFPTLAEDVLKRFHNEARAEAQLQHPNIVQLYEVFQHDGMPFLAMEFVEGETLLEKVRQRTLGRREVVEILAKCCEAMGHAHAKGFIHRDLKPHNVMITPDGAPKIMDFGLAKSLQTGAGACSVTMDGQMVGSPLYMAPEQAGGRQGQLGPQTDVYALGVMLYQCLSGCLPFTAETPAEAIYHILNDEPEPLISLDVSIGEDLSAICMMALEKNPARRYPNAKEMAEDLRRYLRNEPVLARPASVRDTVTKAIRRNYDIAVMSGIAMTVMAVGLTVALTLFARFSSQSAAAALKSRLCSVGNTAALMFQGDELAGIRSAADQNTDEFQSIVRRLNEIRERNRRTPTSPGIDNVYILRRSNAEQLVYVADADAFDHRRRVGSDCPRPVGSVALKGFTAAVVEDKPIRTDRGMTWTAYAPICNSSSRPVAVLALDISADRIRGDEMRPVLRTTMQIGALAAILFMAFTGFAGTRVLRRRKQR